MISACSIMQLEMEPNPAPMSLSTLPKSQNSQVKSSPPLSVTQTQKHTQNGNPSTKHSTSSVSFSSNESLNKQPVKISPSSSQTLDQTTPSPEMIQLQNKLSQQCILTSKLGFEYPDHLFPQFLSKTQIASLYKQPFDFSGNPTTIFPSEITSSTDSSVSKPTKPQLQFIAGVDISFLKKSDAGIASLCVFHYPSMEIVFEIHQEIRLTLEYFAGFLAFREIPGLLQLFDHLKKTCPKYMPQLILVDGNGLLHFRKFGIACHLGVLLDIPTIGVGKNLLYVDGLEKSQVVKKSKLYNKLGGDAFILQGISNGFPYGFCFRPTSFGTKPVFISQGHRVSLADVLFFCRLFSEYRIPFPIRTSDLNGRIHVQNLWPSGEAPVELPKIPFLYVYCKK